MADLGRLWAGAAFGTNTGKLAVELNSDGPELVGTLRFLDDRFGICVYAVTGKFEDSKLELTGSATQAADGVETGDITINGSLSANGELRGEWASALGTGGTFVLFPHDPVPEPVRQSGVTPEQIHTVRRTVGSVILDADDVLELIGFIARDFSFPPGRVVVTYQERGTLISRYASDFEADCSRLGEKRYLKLFVQEPDMYGINRAAVVELSDIGSNEVRVEGVQETWVVGKAEGLASQLKRYERLFTTTVRKIGFNITTLLVVGAVIMLPELSLTRRVVFAIFIWLLVWVVIRLHAKLVPNAILYLSGRKPTFVQKMRPQIISFLIALTSSVVAAVAYGLISGELKALHFAWLGLD